MSKMQNAHQPALSRRAIRTRLLLTLIYAALVPYLIYRVGTERSHLSAVNALLLAALSPAVGSLIEFVRKRQLSVLGLFALVGIAAKVVSALLFHDPHLVLISQQTVSSPPGPQWQEGAGALLLVAAANTSGLLEALETALSCCAPQAGSRLAHLSSSSRQSLLQTLLFLAVMGLSRPWGLRGYTGDALGSLPGRSRAYGYFHTERFLAELARSNGAEAFTSALARWTTRLWQSEVSAGMNVSALFYIDGQTPPGLHRCGFFLVVWLGDSQQS